MSSVYVAAHAPAVGENEGMLGKRMPSFTQKQTGAIKMTPDGYTYLNRAYFPADFAADLALPQATFEARSEILTAASVFNTPLTAAAWTSKPSWAIVAGADKIINPDLERWYYAHAKSHTIVLPGARFGLRNATEGSRRSHRRSCKARGTIGDKGTSTS